MLAGGRLAVVWPLRHPYTPPLNAVPSLPLRARSLCPAPGGSSRHRPPGFRAPGTALFRWHSLLGKPRRAVRSQRALPGPGPRTPAGRPRPASPPAAQVPPPCARSAQAPAGPGPGTGDRGRRRCRAGAGLLPGNQTSGTQREGRKPTSVAREARRRIYTAHFGAELQNHACVPISSCLLGDIYAQ